MHDYLQFNKMTGNEILINMQYCEFLTTGEKLNALLALYNKDRKLDYPWMDHPWFARTVDKWKNGIKFTSYKHCLMGIVMAHKFQLEDKVIWRAS